MIPIRIAILMALALLPLQAYGYDCGNGLLEPHEQCDDGNRVAGDGCRGDCSTECLSDADCPASYVCDNQSSIPCSSVGNCTCLLPCDDHWDCLQGEFCYYGDCMYDPKMPVYHCGNTGCKPGAWCVYQDGTTGKCAEDPSYSCETVCDCGPAHACLVVQGVGQTCVKDVNDLWFPGSSIFGIVVPSLEPTYCCTDPTCHAGMLANSGSDEFRCWDDSAGIVRDYCTGVPCFFSGACEPGETCVDTQPGTTAIPGTSCSQEGGFCVSNAVAEAAYGYNSAQLMPACSGGGFSGMSCEVGWKPGGAYAVERVVGVSGSCGNGSCEDWESALTCSSDCTCGDGRCDTTEITAGSCALDCGTCGDGTCTPPESPKICPADCPVIVGDGSCSTVEVASGLLSDCGCTDSAIYADYPAFCGDGVCQNAGDIPENCDNCEQDCGGNIDSDGDGIMDCVDACPNDPLNDSDSDGLCADQDNCPDDPNSNQLDFDEDGAGDACDTDDDDDGVLDDDDNCPFVANADQADVDGDGAGDVCDNDNDNDGVLDAFDDCFYTSSGEIVNNDGCSISDLCPCDNDWKNHGGYVKCVAHTSEDFETNGLITTPEKDIIVSDAAGSNCGGEK